MVVLPASSTSGAASSPKYSTPSETPLAHVIMSPRLSTVRGRRRRRQLHRDAQPARPPRCEGQGPVVGLGDALDDRQAEADARVVGADPSGAAAKGLVERGDQRWGELVARVLDREHHAAGLNAGPDPHPALF